MLGRNGVLGRFRTLQVARQSTNEQTGRVAQRGKQTRADRTRELAEWGGSIGNGRDTAGRSLTGPYWRLVGPRGAVPSTPLIPWCDQCLA